MYQCYCYIYVCDIISCSCNWILISYLGLMIHTLVPSQARTDEKSISVQYHPWAHSSMLYVSSSKIIRSKSK